MLDRGFPKIKDRADPASRGLERGHDEIRPGSRLNWTGVTTKLDRGHDEIGPGSRRNWTGVTTKFWNASISSQTLIRGGCGQLTDDAALARVGTRLCPLEHL